MKFKALGVDKDGVKWGVDMTWDETAQKHVVQHVEITAESEGCGKSTWTVTMEPDRVMGSYYLMVEDGLVVKASASASIQDIGRALAFGIDEAKRLARRSAYSLALDVISRLAVASAIATGFSPVNGRLIMLNFCGKKGTK